jgi:hypothetical protein
VFLDSRCWRIHRRLSTASLRSILSARQHAPPLLVHDLPAHLPFLPAERRSMCASSPHDFPRAMLEHIATDAQLSVSSFREMPTIDADVESQPRPLYVSTASQAGRHQWSLVVLSGARWCSVVLGGARWCSVVLGGDRWCSVMIGGDRW